MAEKIKVKHIEPGSSILYGAKEWEIVEIFRHTNKRSTIICQCGKSTTALAFDNNEELTVTKNIEK